MASRKLMYIILLICLATFAFLISSWTFLPSTGTIEVTGEGVYTGEFRGKQFHGQGTWTSDMGPVYVGEFKNGYFNGYGTMTFVNDAKYEGYWKDGYMDGEGKMTFPDGHVHEGIWDASEFLGDHSNCDHDH